MPRFQSSRFFLGNAQLQNFLICLIICSESNCYWIFNFFFVLEFTYFFCKIMIGHTSCQIKHTWKTLRFTLLSHWLRVPIITIILCIFVGINLQSRTIEPCSTYGQNVHQVMEEQRNQHKRSLLSLYNFPTNKQSSFLGG